MGEMWQECDRWETGGEQRPQKNNLQMRMHWVKQKGKSGKDKVFFFFNVMNHTESKHKEETWHNKIRTR